MHHTFTARDLHGKRKKAPGTESHRVAVLMTR